tara:strand:- start:63 stop:302 length:240 start_codon:yes stop_codon:yes gene_type:complete
MLFINMQKIQEITIKLLKKKYSNKIGNKTIILNGDINLDSIEMVNLITFIEKKTKKKFQNKFFYKLPNINIKNFSKLFK